ncbi:hypothetical protein CWATWH0005_4870 [Crocosphaera watsonii WH 0005]|uniref:Uncharacterized protein n=6 Tax=Crocosphaera watsonii TaxID=263511 RepID=T2IZG6_CROWT|nr:hypothetical protein [Crocosphaera watsonii]CCQ58398.1 hypothetical protein CWATWH0005_4870 [Crocosphaera watsonii WH 0005]
MALINDTHSKEIQQVYLNFYQNLVRTKPKTLDWKWDNDDDENNEEIQETEKSSQSHQSQDNSSPSQQRQNNSSQSQPYQDNFSPSQQHQDNSSPSQQYEDNSFQSPQYEDNFSQPNNLTASSSQNHPHSAHLSLDKQDNNTTSHHPDSLLFKVTQNGQFIDELELHKDGIKSKQSTDASERLLAQIEILQGLPEGTIIPTAPSIQVQSVEKQGDKTLSTEILLSTDKQGKITKNILSPSPQKTGTQVIHEQLSSLPDNSVVQYLENLIETRVNERINSLSPNLQSQREQDPHNVKWWQQFLQKGGQVFSIFKTEHQPLQVAKQLYYLFSKKVNFPENRLSQNGYTVLRQPSGEQHRYTVLNSNNQPILVFDVNQQQRLSIVDNQLSIDDTKALLNIGKSKINYSQKPQQNPQNTALITRANLVAATLVKMAQKQQQSIRRTGHSYTLAIEPNGDVEISAPGRGIIYHQTLQGNTPIATNLMTETDLTFFERQFQSSQQQSSQQQSSKSSVQTTTPTRSRRR